MPLAFWTAKGTWVGTATQTKKLPTNPHSTRLRVDFNCISQNNSTCTRIPETISSCLKTTVLIFPIQAWVLVNAVIEQAPMTPPEVRLWYVTSGNLHHPRLWTTSGLPTILSTFASRNHLSRQRWRLSGWAYREFAA